MSNQPPLPVVPSADGGDDDDALVDQPDVLAQDGDRPLDPDIDDGEMRSADADRLAAREGTLDGEVDDRP
jgi:hypothetical protein